MDPKLLLVMTITLLYKESLMQNKSAGNSSELARQLINTIKLPEVVTVDRDSNREIIIALRSTVLWMADNPVDYQYDVAELLQRIRVDVAENENLYRALKDVIERAVDEDDKQITRNVLSYRRTLRGHLDQITVKNILKEYSSRANFEGESITDWAAFAQEVAEKIEPFTTVGDDDEHPSIVGSISFDDADAISKVMAEAKVELSTEGVMKSGWQGLNRMLGDAGGFRRGEMVVVQALQHNYKTGVMLSLLKHFALYNVPYMRDKTKKPLLLFITYENELRDNVMWLYKSIKENETGEYCDIRQASEQEAAMYVQEALGKNGYKVEMLRIDPSDFTYRDLFDLVLKYEAMGYEIHALLIDYLNMQSKRGCNSGPQGEEIRDIFRRVRNFTSKRGILCVTPHQMSTDAKLLARNGTESLVEAVANKGYYDGCKRIDQEVDLEIVINIEKIGLESYLAVQRGKHRKVDITEAKHLYFVLKFEMVGGILDDVNGKDLSRKHIGGNAMSEGGGKAWYS